MARRRLIQEKHPLAIRWFHWINFPILFLMIWSGLLIYWGNDVYSITLFGHRYYQFFPPAIYRLLHIPFRLAEGMAFHFLFMWVFFLNGLAYVLYTAISGEWRDLLPRQSSFREAWLVLLHDLHLRKGMPPQGKFNAAQRIAYSGIVFMGLGSILTGLAIYKPVQLYWLVWLCGGYHVARIIHFILTLCYCLFFVVHVIQVILAGWNNFRAMVAGFEVFKPAQSPLTTTPAPLKPFDRPVAFSVTESSLRRRSFISFGIFAGAGLAGLGAWKWLYNSPVEQPGVTKGARGPLRTVLNENERIFRGIFSTRHPVRTYPLSEAAHPNRVRMTGDYGLRSPLPDWKLSVARASGEILSLDIAEIMTLPRTELTYMFKCVEGWDQISNWAGVRFCDFVEHYHLTAEAAMGYVGFETPDKAYYVGIDMPSALHEQTLLAWEMKGRPLTQQHGAPLRLIIPVKYGIKNLKRIGTIAFSDTRPRDYWAEQGYDYYAGL
ncbi:MAG TPA: molybdopterin-dependent oxidoreductase [Dinghuibacter sp.]|uniref:molybdopterin-dependent oxidoreductase n=1 Tax=Dinghuibacter sp. TaxID=2024697 RepID=UPI002C3D9323|nr:molybdopterin-dependent oxidoreductase [Dinghuibacter sp.]HTJ10866.1 molybdopterin-dependent oxidoreductase [Dinghuibacter sp.]